MSDTNEIPDLTPEEYAERVAALGYTVEQADEIAGVVQSRISLILAVGHFAQSFSADEQHAMIQEVAQSADGLDIVNAGVERIVQLLGFSYADDEVQISDDILTGLYL